MVHYFSRQLKRARNALFTALFVIVFSFSALAQSGTGTLTGVVRDSNGANLPGVSVSLRNLATGATRTVTSNEDGYWSAPSLSVGAYQVMYELTGFKKLVRDHIDVEAAVPRSLDDRLEVGIVDATITITEGAALITPDSSAVARQLSADQLVTVPTSTRSFTQLLSAEAGVSTDLSPVLTNSNGNQSPSVNGTRTTSTSLSFNGVDATNITSNEGSLNNNIAPAPETLSEVKLQTSLYDASTGRSGGGNFQLVTKTGGNQFHGSAYYYLQNEKFNANDFFFNKDGIERPKARRNEGGFTIGGPLIKERVFFFGGYQHTSANTGFVPTANSVTVLPRALQLISGERTKQNLFDAFRALNPGIVASIPNAAAISDVAVRLLNVMNPATGDFMIPAPRPGEQTSARTPTLPVTLGAIRSSDSEMSFPRSSSRTSSRCESTARSAGKTISVVRFSWQTFPASIRFPIRAVWRLR